MSKHLLQLPLLLVGIAAAVWGYQRRVEQHTQAEFSGRLSLPDLRTVRLTSLGYERLASDYYWLRAIQYYGNERHRDAGYPDLSRLIDLVTQIAPRFDYAYRFAGVAVLYNHPTLGFLNVDEAIALLERGVRERPDVWEIGMLLGFTQLWHRGDAKAAIKGFEIAARAEGRPPYVPLLATRLHAHSGDLGAGLALANALVEEFEEPELKFEMEKRVVELKIEMVLQRLERAASDFEEAHARRASGIDELLASVPELLARGEELAEYQLGYDPEENKVTSALLPRRLVLPPEAVKEAREQRSVGKAEPTP